MKRSEALSLKWIFLYPWCVILTQKSNEVKKKTESKTRKKLELTHTWLVTRTWLGLEQSNVAVTINPFKTKILRDWDLSSLPGVDLHLEYHQTIEFIQ